MALRSTYIGVGAMVAVMLFAPSANAQIVTVDSNYLPPPNPMQPMSVFPSGTWSASLLGGAQYDVRLDYGTLVSGSFVPWPGGPAQSTWPTAAGGTWTTAQRVMYGNPPAGLHVRAQLVKKAGPAPLGTVHTAYSPCF